MEDPLNVTYNRKSCDSLKSHYFGYNDKNWVGSGGKGNENKYFGDVYRTRSFPNNVLYRNFIKHVSNTIIISVHTFNLKLIYIQPGKQTGRTKI